MTYKVYKKCQFITISNITLNPEGRCDIRFKKSKHSTMSWRMITTFVKSWCPIFKRSRNFSLTLIKVSEHGYFLYYSFREDVKCFLIRFQNSKQSRMSWRTKTSPILFCVTLLSKSPISPQRYFLIAGILYKLTGFIGIYYSMWLWQNFNGIARGKGIGAYLFNDVKQSIVLDCTIIAFERESVWRAELQCLKAVLPFFD